VASRKFLVRNYAMVHTWISTGFSTRGCQNWLQTIFQIGKKEIFSGHCDTSITNQKTPFKVILITPIRNLHRTIVSFVSRRQIGADLPNGPVFVTKQQYFANNINTMPCLSKKKQYMKALARKFSFRLFMRGQRELLEEEDSIEDAVDLALAQHIQKCESKRYLFHRSHYREGECCFDADLQLDESSHSQGESTASEQAGKMAWLTDDEFLQKYRMSCQSFFRVLSEIQDHEVFQPKSKSGRKQAPVAHQLMVFLKYIGTEGTGGSNANQRHVFHIGYGTSHEYRKRVLRAILSLRDKFVFWPDEAERIKIAREIHKEYHFPHLRWNS
jgi:hypothetical protein